MIFIYENQYKIIEQSNSIYKNVPAYKEANLIYKCLYHLEDDLLNQIEKIYLIVQEEISESTIEYGLKHYCADVDKIVNEEEIVIEIFHLFPSVDELENVEKSKRVEKLINEITIKIINAKKEYDIFLKHLKNNDLECLVFLPFCKSFSTELIDNLSDNNCILFTDSKSALLRVDEGYHFLNRKRFNSIKEVLAECQRTYAKKSPSPISNRKYQPKEFLANFDRGFFDRIVLLNREYKKRLHFFGHDSFIAKKAIERILSAVDKYYYYLPQDLNKIDNESQSMVIYNFDSIDNPKGYKLLYDKVKNINETFYIVLQAIRNIHSQYFSHFESIEIPKEDEIRKRVTGLFLSLLLEKRLYDDYIWRLFPLVEFNLLKKLIPECESLEYIHKALCEFSELNFNDLINNSIFWYILGDKVKEFQTESKQRLRFTPRKKIIFDHTGNHWHILGFGNPIYMDYSENIGIKYLVAVIKAQDSIDSTKVRNIALNYNGDHITLSDRNEKIKEKIIDVVDLIESDRKTISSAISRLKKEPTLKEFIEEYFTFSGNRNYFNHKNKIDVKVIDTNWQDSYLT